jgi:hypothetical protein
MKLAVKFVGAEPNEQTPGVALYRVNASGQVAGKLGVARNGELEISPELTKKKSAVVALGPDVADISVLDAKSLLQLRVSDQLAAWEKNNEISLPSLWWRQWIFFTVCVSGGVSKCRPWFLDVAAVKANALLSPALSRFPEICTPICNAVVEVWEDTCCCWPILVIDVPVIIGKLQQFLAQEPIRFPPVPNPPDPAPSNRTALDSVNRALAQGKSALQFAPNTDLARHLVSLQSLSAEEAIRYIEVNPSLWRFWCECRSAMVGETVVNPDGTFNFCWEQFPFLLINCRRSYFYKVKQWNGVAWVYIYDGAAARQYFNADQYAALETLLGQTCGQPPPPPGTDFAMLQQIGGTSSYLLHSNWGGASSTDVDLTQTSEFGLSTPPQNGGLVDFGGYTDAPWAQTLNFLLYFHPGLEALGVFYYRLSIVAADATGSPQGGATPVPFPGSVAWAQWVLDGSGNWVTQGQILGPVSKGAQNGLFQIPYADDALWLGDQFHQSLDTTKYANGRYLIVLELFDKTGKRLIPAGAPADPGDIPTNFTFLRWLAASGTGSTATVPYAALTHLLWIDNRHVYGAIEDLDVSGVASSKECQFLSGPGTSLFQVGFRAFHVVMGDSSPNPIPPATFMQDYSLTWSEGLGGGSGTLCSVPPGPPPPCTAGDVNQPSTMFTGPNVKTLPVSFASLLGPPPAPQACAFTVNLSVSCKHTDGSSHINAYDVNTEASFAISIV